jgi:hypothetical protein
VQFDFCVGMYLQTRAGVSDVSKHDVTAHQQTTAHGTIETRKAELSEVRQAAQPHIDIRIDQPVIQKS